MNLLFDIGHPAHVHLFKNVIPFLKDNGHNITVTSRKKDVTNSLLDYYKIDHLPLSRPRLTRTGMLRELLIRNRQIFELHREKRFDASFGTSVSIGFLNRKFNVPAYNFNEDDDIVVKLYSYLAYPFATAIINPDCIEFKKWPRKRVLYPSYHELAYLHPNNFTPDVKLLNSYGLTPGKYVLIRLSALNAHHDKRMKGISKGLLEKIKDTLSEYQIIESYEIGKNKLNPWDIHHLLANAKMIISDSQTMTIEGAVLGVPSVRINTFIGKSTVIGELENKFSLAFGYFPNQELEILETVDYLANEHNISAIWQDRRDKFLSQKVDLNEWMKNYFNKLLN